MRRVIDRKIYDTETAEEIADVSAPCNDSGDFAYEETHLYRTKNGRWFIAGNGGPASRWRRFDGNGMWGSGQGLQPLDVHEVVDLLERRGLSAMIEKHFADLLSEA
jgi:hypothetical protein